MDRAFRIQFAGEERHGLDRERIRFEIAQGAVEDLDTRRRPLIADAEEREVRAKIAAVQRDSSSLDPVANTVGDGAEVLLRCGADPSDARVARIRKKSAGVGCLNAQALMYSRNAGSKRSLPSTS